MNELLLIGVPVTLSAILIAILCILLIINLHEVVMKRRVRGVSADLDNPDVTILIDSYDLGAVRQSLSSLGTSGYRSFDVVVIDNMSEHASSVALAKLVRGQGYVCRYYRPRKIYEYSSRLRQAYARSRKGQLVLVLARGAAVGPDTLKSIAMRYHKGIHSSILLQPFSREMGYIGVIEVLGSSISRLMIRCYFIVRSPKILDGNSYVVNSSIIRKAQQVHPSMGDGSIRIFDADLYLFARIPSFIIGGVRLACAISMVIAATLLIINAINGEGIEAFILSWGIVALIGLVLVMFDPIVSLRQKLDSALCTTFMPILLTISLIISSIRSIFFKSYQIPSSRS